MIEEFLIDVIVGNYTVMFEDINAKVGDIALNAGQTPQGWNTTVFNIVRALSETVVIPIAGMIISFVLVHELVGLFTEKNNLNDAITYPFFKFVFKAGIAIYLLSHTWDITMAIFDVGQHLVLSSAGFISNAANIDISSQLTTLQSTLEGMGIPSLFGLVIETFFAKMAMWVITILVLVRVNMRMMAIYLYCAAAPIPFATLTNREWGQTGNNYLRGVIALAFEGFFMMVVVAIYTGLVQTMDLSGDLHVQTLLVLAYTILLCLALFKTESLSKSIFNAH